LTDITIANLHSVAPLLQSLLQSLYQMQSLYRICSSVIVFDSCVPEPPIETAKAAIEVGLASGVGGIVTLRVWGNLKQHWISVRFQISFKIVSKRLSS